MNAAKVMRSSRMQIDCEVQSDEEKILIVDDDADIREELGFYFEMHGMKTIVAENAMAARDALSREHISLAIVDIVMPGETGLELTRWMADNTAIPVILLTSLDDVIDRVAGIEIGADDYVPKPFSPRELLARSKAILRRDQKVLKSFSAKSRCICTLEMDQRLIFSSGRVEKLRPTEEKLLRILVASEGECISRERLFLEVLGRAWNPDDRGIDNLIARLRKIMGGGQSDSDIIKTIRHIGYMVYEGGINVSGV